LGARKSIRPVMSSSIATGAWGWGAGAPNPSPAGIWELPKSQEKKLDIEWGVLDHLGQTNYAEIRILVTKYKIHFKTE